jgi:hypothetical protein
MQVDAPPEDNDNNEEEPYVVENPSLVCCKIELLNFLAVTVLVLMRLRLVYEVLIMTILLMNYSGRPDGQSLLA